jgi:hypothetical protein
MNPPAPGWARDREKAPITQGSSADRVILAAGSAPSTSVSQPAQQLNLLLAERLPLGHRLQVLPWPPVRSRCDRLSIQLVGHVADPDGAHLRCRGSLAGGSDPLGLPGGSVVEQPDC